jgi:hypothetical protein
MPSKEHAAEDRRWARELEETAADYVGERQAHAMAMRGYFKAEIARHRRAGIKPPWHDQPRTASMLAPQGSAADVYSQGVADGAAGRPHALTDHPEYIAGYREGTALRK